MSGSRQDVPPWQRGQTYQNGDLTISDPTNVALYGQGGVNLEGRTYVFEADADATYQSYSSLGSDPTGRQITVKVVRNNSTANLLPGYVVHYDSTTTGIYYESRVDGVCESVADRPAGVVDDYIGANGVPPGDMCYIVIDGPSRGLNTDGTQTVWAIGDRLVPATAGSTRADAAGGRLVKQDLTGATSTLGNNIQNQVGYAAAAATSGSVATVGTVLIPIVVKLID